MFYVLLCKFIYCTVSVLSVKMENYKKKPLKTSICNVCMILSRFRIKLLSANGLENSYHGLVVGQYISINIRTLASLFLDINKYLFKKNILNLFFMNSI